MGDRGDCPLESQQMAYTLVAVIAAAFISSRNYWNIWFVW
jgi:hypothetical protein